MNKSLTPFVLALVLLISGAVLIWRAPQPELPDTASQVPPPAETREVTLLIEDVFPEETVTVRASTTALELLEALEPSHPQLKLTTENHDEMGTLVTGLGDFANGDGNKYWHYYVNGELPMVGADRYILEDGDLIEWRFEESQM